MKQEKKIRVKQTRSLAGRNDRVRDTLKALGLGRIGKEREFSVNPALVGMLEKVEHLVSVEVIK
jgi:large subunit ribosomal protein L30